MPRRSRPDRMRGDRESSTSSARREKQVVRLLWLVEGEGGTRLHRVDDAGGSTSQTDPSQTVDPTQYQHEQHHRYQYYQEEAYQPQY